jgi:hypothetical protein
MTVVRGLSEAMPINRPDGEQAKAGPTSAFFDSSKQRTSFPSALAELAFVLEFRLKVSDKDVRRILQIDLQKSLA